MEEVEREKGANKDGRSGSISSFSFSSSLRLLSFLTLKYPLSRTGSATPSKNEEWAAELLVFLAFRVMGADVRRCPAWKHGAAEVGATRSSSAAKAARSEQSTAARAIVGLRLISLL